MGPAIYNSLFVKKPVAFSNALAVPLTFVYVPSYLYSETINELFQCIGLFKVR